MNNKQLKGIGLLFFTTSLYGLYGIYARLIALEFSVFTQNWVRNFFVLLLAIILIFLLKQKWKKIAKKDARWILGWVLCDIFFVIALFISFNTLSIGTALFLLYSGSTIAAYAAGTFLLKEKVTKVKIIAILFSFIGLLFVYGGQVYSIKIFFLMLGFFSGIFAGLWFVFPKLISEEYPKLQLIVLDAGGILLVNLLLAGIYNQSVPPLAISLAWLGIFLYGITQLVGDLLVIHGFRLVEAHIGSLILPLEAVFGVLFAYLFFKETLPIMILFGGLLIILGALLPNIQEILKRKRRNRQIRHRG